MYKITFKTLKLENFKGVKSLSFDFSGGIDEFIKPNKSGKTSSLEAISFMLFKKNLNNNIFTIQSTKTKQKPSIELTLLIEDKGVISTKVLAYKNETYYINDFEYKTEKYYAEIKKFFRVEEQEELFTMICAPAFLNFTPSKRSELFLSIFMSPQIAQSIIKSHRFNRDTDVLTDGSKIYPQVIEEIKEHGFKSVLDKVKALKSKKNKLLGDRRTLGDYLIDNYGLAYQYAVNLNEEWLNEVDEKLFAYTLAKSLFLKIVNKEIERCKFNFKVSFITEDEKEKFSISQYDVNFNELNNAQQIKLSIEISRFLQLRLDSQFPILIDTAESLDNTFFDNTNYTNQMILMSVGSVDRD